MRLITHTLWDNMSDHMDWFSKKEWQNQLTMTSSYLLLRLNLYPRISHAEKESVSVSASAAPCSSVSCSSSDSGSTCLISSQVLKRSRGTLRCINVEMTLSKFLSLPYEAPMIASTISARSYRNGNVRFGYRLKIEKNTCLISQFPHFWTIVTCLHSLLGRNLPRQQL